MAMLFRLISAFALGGAILLQSAASDADEKKGIPPNLKGTYTNSRTNTGGSMVINYAGVEADGSFVGKIEIQSSRSSCTPSGGDDFTARYNDDGAVALVVKTTGNSGCGTVTMEMKEDPNLATNWDGKWKAGSGRNHGTSFFGVVE